MQVIRDRGGAAFSTPPPEEADKKPPASGDDQPADGRQEEAGKSEEGEQELGLVNDNQGEDGLEPAGGELHEASDK